MAEPLRVASFNAELSRDGPGVLLGDIVKGDAQVDAVVAVIAAAAPDILGLQSIDYDLNGAALQALARRLEDAGQSYPYRFAGPPNSGVRTGLDMDGDGRSDSARDTQGFGRFTGQGGMAVLSRYPILQDELRDFSDLLWRDLPGASMPEQDGAPFPSEKVQAIQRLSSVAHWDVPVKTPGGVLHLLTFHATPPVFDGPEDRNGLRNRDELRLWQVYLSGGLPQPAPGAFVILGDANIDPADGDGRPDGIRALLSDGQVIDPQPRSAGGLVHADPGHTGDPALDTVAFDGPGNLRVDYVLPAATLKVLDAGVIWPAPDAPFAETVRQASRHRLVWVDLALP